MKRKLAWGIQAGTISIAVFLFASCEEIGPQIDLTGDTTADTTYIASQVELPQEKNVLLEEFTGVSCPNCPEGHELIDNFKTLYGSSFIAVSAHSNFLAAPHDGDQYLRTQDAQDLEDFLGDLLAKPSAAIDRKLFSGEPSLLNLCVKWPAFVNQEMNQTASVNIYLETAFDNNNRDLNVTVRLHYTSEDTTGNKLTVMLLEDDIVTSQSRSGLPVDTHYVQNRVLRKILTSVSGFTITPSIEPGRVVVKTLIEHNLPALWKEHDLRIVALVHRSGSSKEVLQTVEKDVR